jgi:2-oxoglutarate dehydrogenase E1 component
MSDLRAFHGPNAGYVLGLFERYQQDPNSVDERWRSYFRSFTPPAPEAAAGVDLAAVVGAHELAESIRARGHTAARLDPLGSPRAVDPALEPGAHGLREDALRGLPAAVVGGPVAARAADAADGIRQLREIYAGTVGYEFDHVLNSAERDWLREAIESGRFRAPASVEQKRQLLERLSEVEGFEKYLHKTFFGQKRFSVEGTDLLVPVIDEIIEQAAHTGKETVVIGMAHRGRLNVLVHVLGKPYEMILSGFQGTGKATAAPAPDELTGDVKYHMGWEGVHRFDSRQVRVLLAPNPSHLEFVNPVVVGMTRAAQDETDHAGAPALDVSAALPILVHGDAAFPGQGVVPETLNMGCLDGYTVGGTIHIIANNQIGFTTDPDQGRSTRYASDLAKGFEIPIVHVNADDAEACLAVARLAQEYRARFHKDFLIDLVGYRRWGHNEGDEPLFTQPRMYDVIRNHPTAREQWAARLVEDGVLSAEEADGMLQAVYDRLDEVRQSLSETGSARAGAHAGASTGAEPAEVETAIPAERLTEYNEALLDWPQGFSPNARLAKLLERRRDALGPEGGIDWGHAETLAFASLLAEGVPIRLTGQDVQRGTFSHRHQVLRNAETGESLTPLAVLPAARASFEIHNSPLSEMAVLGFEYGYSVADPQVLVLWEAQFGDFANGAQVIIDQFIAAAQVKWEQTSGLVMLLPHGYEGQGPEHSSARLERFLQLAAQGNLRVANCTTSAQYFHLLRRQALLLDRDPRPLVVMSPKSLLRHPLAASRLEQLAQGRFHPVLGDDTAEGREDEVTRLLLCSGKVYVDLVGSEHRDGAHHVALARVEELYPLPTGALRAEFQRFPPPAGDRLGAGGAAQHGRVGVHGAPPRGTRTGTPRSRAASSAPPGRARRRPGAPGRRRGREGYWSSVLGHRSRCNSFRDGRPKTDDRRRTTSRLEN